MIFVSAPYTDPDKQVIDYRMKMVSLYCAQLLKQGENCLTPLTHGTCIFKYTTLPSDFEFWKKMSYGMLKASSKMHVLKLDGWKESTGVKAEIEFAILNKIEISYIDVSQIQL